MQKSDLLLQRPTGSALHEAACCGHAGVVEEMLKHGAKHDAATAVSTFSSLY
jgi:hypothetical protein